MAGHRIDVALPVLLSGRGAKSKDELPNVRAALGALFDEG